MGKAPGTESRNTKRMAFGFFERLGRGEKCHLNPGYTMPFCWDKYQLRLAHFEVIL
jgi:hypothetical protein